MVMFLQLIYRRKSLLLLFFSTFFLHSSISWSFNQGNDDKKMSDAAYRKLLFDAFNNDDISAIKNLYDGRKIYDDNGLTPLYRAVTMSHSSLVKYLLRANADANEPNKRRFVTRTLRKCATERTPLAGVQLHETHEAPRLTRASSQTIQIAKLKAISGAPMELVTNEKLPLRLQRSQSTVSNRNSNDLHAIRGAIAIVGKTPLFALAEKTNYLTIDFKIAELLFEYGAKLEVKDQSGVTPLDIIERRFSQMADMIQNDQSKVSSKEQKPQGPDVDDAIDAMLREDPPPNFERARRLFLLSLKDADANKKITPNWYLFANAKTTATLMAHAPSAIAAMQSQKPGSSKEAEKESKPSSTSKLDEALLPFKTMMVSWSLDAVLPEPRDAYSYYKKVKSILADDKTRFLMVLNYFVLYNEKKQQRESRAKVVERVPFLSPATLYIYKPQQIANAIYAVHRDLFLEIVPKDLIIKFLRNESIPRVNQFIGRIDTLSGFIQYAIVSGLKDDEKAAEKVHDRVKFWHRVARQLVVLGDTFGTLAITTALNSRPITRLVGENNVPDVTDFQNINSYMRFRNDRNEAPLIPFLVHEGTRLIGHFDRLCLRTEDLLLTGEQSLSFMQDAFVKDIEAMQTAVKYATDVSPPELIAIFKNLSPSANMNAADLLSFKLADNLRSSKKSFVDEVSSKNLTADLDSRDLYAFLRKQNLRDLVSLAVDTGIYDGKTLVEKMAIANSVRFQEIPCALFQVFGVFNGYNKMRGYSSFGDAEACLAYPVDILKNSTNSFEWMMWLSNNGLAHHLDQCVAQRLDSFRAFMRARVMAKDEQQFYRGLGIVKADEQKTLEHLIYMAMSANHIADEILSFKRKDIEAWLLRRGLSHLQERIKRDRVFTGDRFVALFFLHQNFGCRTLSNLGFDKDWHGKVFEALGEEYNVARELDYALNNSGLPNKATKKEKHSRVFFIKVLRSLSVTQALPKLYEAKVYNLERFEEKFLMPKAGSSTENVDVANPTALLDLGFKNEQIEVLRGIIAPN